MSKNRIAPRYVEPGSISFSIFSEKNIKDLSVLQIVTPLTLDSLGHPVLGGLYDNRLGPCTDKSLPCGTCGKSSSFCAGHFGFIELPVPCENPFFHKVIGTILKYSCLSCHRLQLPEESRKKIEILKEQKDVEVVQNEVVELILKQVKLGKYCIYCKKSLDRIQVMANRILMISRKSEKMRRSSQTEQDEQDTTMDILKPLESKFVNASQSRSYLRQIWFNEEDLIRIIIPVINDVDITYPTDALFFQVIPVPPPNVRPINYMNGRVLEHPQTTFYKNILTSALVMNHLIRVVQKKGDVSVLPSQEAKDVYLAAKGKSPIEKLNNCWESLQAEVNSLLSKDARFSSEGIGLKQIIEKKEGIIRQNMMGKRVNFAARSVVTPDPNLDIGEVGIPELFAKKLTYPVPVTPWNVEHLRQLIRNGPKVHPGALFLEMEDGTVKRIDEINKEAFAKILLTPQNEKRHGFQGVKIVHRHLQNGDIMLLNRQPTLHKPSIMAHRARILRGERTLRLHYANCKAYNADFDGDEMNAHLPQDEVARSEGYNIAEVAQQYLVPKDGTPLSGLIQDHMISGVRLSLRGRFFSRSDYHQLVFQALPYKTDNIILLMPAIVKPEMLWSGKQILSTVIINILPRDRERINLTSTSKISAKAWQKDTPRTWKAGGTPFRNQIDMTEAEIVIRGGELLCGILDKNHYGATPYGLVHCVYELYGGTYATRLLSSFAKLFARFLQQNGFTLGVRDILCVPKADKKRRKEIKKSRKIGKDAVANALGLNAEEMTVEELSEKVEERCSTDPTFRQVIDRSYKTFLDSYTNAINKCCLSDGLVSKFPENNLQLMVQSGAKGSTVNTMQISCLLGQIELEGKRPPVMISGKSHPSFPAFEFCPKAGGFIDGRFMTGIQPQDFFFHCMAGREGLIDTAVKTSRSGYLQRCLIKHLEGLYVGYDLTVRNSDQSVIQFLYGEDGMDILKSQFFDKKQLPFLEDNAKCIIQKPILKQLKTQADQKLVEEHKNKLLNWIAKNGPPLQKRRGSPFNYFLADVKKNAGKEVKMKKIEKMWRGASDELKNTIKGELTCPDPINSVLQPDHYFGVLSERLELMKENYIERKPNKVKKRFEDMFNLKGMQSMCAPGEPVGLVAAQSIGEPSTQMTLNTFHFAGRGEMNVTLGIPRLREILMMASKNIKTPSMEIPFKSVPDLELRAQDLKKRLTRVVVGEVLEKIDVTVNLELTPTRQHKYTLRFQFLPSDCYSEDYMASIKSILKHMKNKFFREMFVAIAKVSKVKSNLITMDEAPKTNIGGDDDSDDEGPTTKKNNDSNRPGGGDGDSSDDEIEDEDDAKLNTKHHDKQEDQEPEDEEEKRDAESDNEFEADDETPKDSDTATDDSVASRYSFANSYKEDRKQLYCQLSFSLPMSYDRLDLTAILKDVAAKSIIWETPSIKRAITYMKDQVFMLKTDGINIEEMFKYHDLLDLNRLYSNDIHKMANTYGIEAASKIIVKEVKDVFNVYGIKVDPRHLSLIADYMTQNGIFEPLSRKGMESSNSPLQQMSFESSSQFLKAATIKGKSDDLTNPSSTLMVGKPCITGTGAFTLLHKIPNLSF